MVKVLKPVPENKAYCEIILLLSKYSKGSYPAELSKHLKKNRPTITRQLSYLKNQGWVDDQIKGKKHVYRLNLNKIFCVFFEFLKEKFGVDVEAEKVKSIQNNPYITKFFQILLREYFDLGKEQNKKYTLEYVFEMITSRSYANDEYIPPLPKGKKIEDYKLLNQFDDFIWAIDSLMTDQHRKILCEVEKKVCDFITKNMKLKSGYS